MAVEKERKITLYPSNWLYNAGVVGFLRVLEFGGKRRAFEFKGDGSVEVEISALDGFEIYYFEYASKLYLLQNLNLKEIINFAKGLKNKESNKIISKIQELENGIQRRVFNLKGNKKWSTFRKEVLNIKTESMRKVKEIVRELKKSLNTKKERRKIKEIVDNINKYFADICFSVFDFKAQADFLGRFYFNKVVIANPKGENLKRPEDFKERYLNPILEMLNRENGDNLCILCGKNYPEEGLSELSEGDFSILGISSNTFANFYNYYAMNGVSYNRKCHLCQLILLCAFAGFNLKPWQMRELDGTDYIFVNYPSFEEVFSVNNKLQTLLDKFHLGIFTEKINTYFKSFELILQLAKKKTRWLLENTYFAEIKVSARKDQAKPKFVYFNIDKAFSEIFSEFKLDTLLNNLSFLYEIYKGNSVYLSTEILKRLIEKKPLIHIAFKMLSEKLSERDKYMLPIWSLILLEFLINQKRRLNMSAEKSYGILKSIQAVSRRSFSIEEIDQEKRFHISQRFLTLIRGGRKEDFYHELLRLFVVYKKPVPENLFSLLTESEEISFQEKALAFLTGFINPTEEETSTVKEKETNTGGK